MAQRTFAKMFKAVYDIRNVLGRIGVAADLLAQYDPDQRSSGAKNRREFRKASTQYKSARKRFDQLMVKFAKFDLATMDRINTVLTNRTSTGKRGRPKGSKNKEKTNGRKRGRKSAAKKSASNNQ